MNDENLCNDGKCRRVRLGEERHSKHKNQKIQKSEKYDIFRKPNQVQILFFGLIVLGGIITFLTNNSNENYPVMDNPIIKISFTTIGFILIGLAFAVLNKGSTIHTEDRIQRIEKKLDKLLEHRDDVFQNK